MTLYHFKEEHYIILVEWLENDASFALINGSRSKTKVRGDNQNRAAIYNELALHLNAKAK